MFHELGLTMAENANKTIELLKENTELKAHCEFLEECCHRLGNGLRVEKDEVDSIPQHSLNKIKARAIIDFKNYIKSGLKVINEPSWERRKIEIDDSQYFEITLSEFDDYANKLRGEK